MNNVGRPGDAPANANLNQNASGGAAGSLGERRALHSFTERDSLEFDEDTAGSSYTASEREADFLNRLRAASRESEGEEADDGNGQTAQDDQKLDAQVIVVVEQTVWTGLPSPAGSATDAQAAEPSMASAVSSVMEAIDRSIRAEMAPRPGQPIKFAIAFHDEGLGLAGLRLTVTKTTLDVVFERTGDGPFSEELARAAQLLAERLMTRFSKRTVRILDATRSSTSENGEAAASLPSPLDLFL